MRFCHEDTFPYQDLNDTMMVETVIIRIGIDVCKCKTIKLCIGQRMCDLRLQSILLILIFIEGIFEIGGNFIVICFGKEPENRRFLLGLIEMN